MDSPLPCIRMGTFSDENFLDHSFATPGPSFAADMATDSKMTSLVSFINRELTSLGLKSLKVEENSSNEADVTKLSLALACVEAFQRINQTSKRTEELQLAFKRVCNDNNSQANLIKKLKGQVELLERECAKFKESERQKKNDSNKTLQKLNLEKQNSKKIHASIQQKVTQLEHSLKRKEKENQVLKEKLDSFLGSKVRPGSGVNNSSKSNNLIQPACIEILNDNKPKRAKWMVNVSCACEESEKQEFLKAVINNLEEKQKVVISENMDLRNLLSKVDVKLREVARESISNGENSSCDAMFSMPAEVLQEVVFKSFVGRIENLAAGSKKDSLNGTFEISGSAESLDNGGLSELEGGRPSLMTDDEDNDV